MRGLGVPAFMLAIAISPAACARPPVGPAPKSQVRKDRTNPNAITAVVFGGNTVYALTYTRGLRAWTGDGQPMRPLALEHVLALADDGSIAVTAEPEKEGERGSLLQVWTLPGLKRLCYHSFEHGIERVLAVSARTIALLVNTGYTTNPNEGIPQLPPPRSIVEIWSFTGVGFGGRIDTCEEHAMFSADGQRFVCTRNFGWVSWLDLESGRSASPELASDWLPPSRPERRDELDLAPRGRPSISRPPYLMLSVRLSANGDDVYVAYTRMRGDGEGPAQPSDAWRLERWTPPLEETGRGSVARLATAGANLHTRLLAISGDGRLAVLGSHNEPLVVRRAPGYEPQQLAAGASMAAAVSADGSRIVSGHQDGTLRLWDASSGRLLAATGGP